MQKVWFKILLWFTQCSIYDVIVHVWPKSIMVVTEEHMVWCVLRLIGCVVWLISLIWISHRMRNTTLKINHTDYLLFWNQGSTLRPVGSPMRLDFIQWRLVFSTWSPNWPLRFLDFFLRLLMNGVNVNLKPGRI